MKKVTVLIDGYNLYHAVDEIGKPHLKWVNPKLFCKFFIQNHSEEIIAVKFFTAFPNHKSSEVQQRYLAFTGALKHFDIEVIEGKFKRKINSFYSKGEKFTRITNEEKESDVNLALAILEDAYEKTSDKLLVITNDSDISPAIRMARRKNPRLKIGVITPPLEKTKKANYDLADACGSVNRNKLGQVYFKTAMIREFMLEQSALPDEIIIDEKTKITIPKEYKKV